MTRVSILRLFVFPEMSKNGTQLSPWDLPMARTDLLRSIKFDGLPEVMNDFYFFFLDVYQSYFAKWNANFKQVSDLTFARARATCFRPKGISRIRWIDG